jgi:sigma-B regulation protein RsbU (phosphoserine phosphatase)
MSETPPDPPAPPPAANVLSMVLVNRIDELARIGERIERFGGECGLPGDETWRVNLVLDELVSNIIRHGYDDEQEHRILVTVAFERNLLTISIEDDARPFNPLDAPAPDLDRPIEERPIGGLGVFLVKSFVDTLEYRRTGDRNILTLKKRLSAAPGPAAPAP